MDKVAIIVPMYNVEKYVEKCLNSLIKQTYKKIEIYAISDGSPDKSIDIARKIAKKDDRIKCIEKENGGYGSVLEYAISIIKTKDFLICDPDDWMEQNAIEVLYKEAIKDTLDVVVADKYNVFFETHQTEYCSSSTDFYPIKSNYVEEKNIGKFSFLKVSPHAKLYKTAIAKEIIFPHKCSYTDFILYLCSLNNAKRVKYIKQPLAYYLLDRPGNTATDFSLKAINNHIIVWNSAYTQLKQTKDDYLIYRLYFEYKMIIKLYLNYRKNNKKDLNVSNELNNIKRKIRENSHRIKKVIKKTFKERIVYKIITNNLFKL